MRDAIFWFTVGFGIGYSAARIQHYIKLAIAARAPRRHPLPSLITRA